MMTMKFGGDADGPAKAVNATVQNSKTKAFMREKGVIIVEALP
jgi:hypothetical protein